MSYIILTNKETYKTETNTDGIELIESYDYKFFNKLKATYSIAKVNDPRCRITLIENSEKAYTNHVPVKFFEAFENIEEAREELKELAGPNSEDAKLEKQI